MLLKRISEVCQLNWLRGWSHEDDRTYWTLSRLELFDHVHDYHLINDNTRIWSFWSLLEVRTYKLSRVYYTRNDVS